ncbi:MAG: hypothetical protein ABI564_04160 [Ideonella sp.]
MIDRIFTLTLTFAILIGSTLAIGADFFAPQTVTHHAKAVTVLPRVVITGSVTPDTKLASDDTSRATRAQ